MRRSISVVLVIAVMIAAMHATILVASCFAGQNAGGALLFHANPQLTYTSDVGNYNGLSDAPTCANFITRHDGTEPVVIHLLAVFAQGAHPVVRAAEFGIDYDANKISILSSGRAGDLEIEMPGWPAPGTSTAVTFHDGLTATVNEVYWFAAYASSSDAAEIRVTGTARRGGQPPSFGDDGIPAELDEVSILGSFGFNQDGRAPCPTFVQTVGACCFEYECQLLSSENCAARGGEYIGDGSECDPGRCRFVPLYRCCLEGQCLDLSETECTSKGGTFMAEHECEWHTCYTGGRGGCCRDGDGCLTLSESQCSSLGGRYLGDGVACDAVKCPGPVVGACCIPERGCVQGKLDQCVDWGGDYKGDGTTCDPDPCPTVEPRVGACCTPDGACSLLDSFSCAQRGRFLGAGTDCDPSPCGRGDHLPGQRSTWGNLKDRYR